MLKNGPINSSVPKKTARDIKLSRVLNCADAETKERRGTAAFKHKTEDRSCQKVRPRNRRAPRPATAGVHPPDSTIDLSWHSWRGCQTAGLGGQLHPSQTMSEIVKVCGCRPHEGGAAHTAGPSYANLQGRKPRGVGRGVASDAMGISSLGVRCRGALTTAVGSGRRGGELGRSIAIAGTGVAQRRLIDELVARGVAPASMVMADRETARQRRNGMSRRTGSGHDVSIPITAGR